ncbi:hypothetical protein AB833_06305 [Chromatiales bacterium (ex Bugula neritina AB1)]|nr:hypothetical protein AB833_06305 [Chromatiales bacterium (ex Bugula neritina AB1)]
MTWHPHKLGEALKQSNQSIEMLLTLLKDSNDTTQKVGLTCELIIAVFDQFYTELCAYPRRAQTAFEQRDPNSSILISRDRLELYSEYIEYYTPLLLESFEEIGRLEALWEAFEARFLQEIEHRYEADIAFSFANSIERRIYQGEWKPVAYSFSQPSIERAKSRESAYRTFDIKTTITQEQMVEILGIPQLNIPYINLHADAQKIVERIEQIARLGEYDDQPLSRVDILKGGFFRDLTAFIVGRVVKYDGTFAPFVIALLNDAEGLRVDAFLHKTADAHNLLSSTLANFHVTNDLYYQTCVFLYSIMPKRPLGLHYSTIGFNHVGKVAVIEELKSQLQESGSVLASSPGYEGTVAIGFTFEASTYHLKVIRNTPTKSYKWGEFEGIDAVLDKYRIVHQINRTGSMVDNIIYHNLRLHKDLFAEDLLLDITTEASDSVSLHGDYVLFKSLIVQLKIIPLPVYFDSASDEQIKKIINNLGHCIKNNMAANIFNRDLDARNYGVGRYDKVFLFDYDALEQLTDIKIRTNLDRIDGEEDIPDWYFEDGVVFLPEEIESGLQLEHREARRHFRDLHADLLTVDYWQGVQDQLQQGEVLGLRSYPESRKLG